MASAKEIKRKINSIKNTWKITKAMELISTVKMKKAQDKALSKKDFVFEILKVFFRIHNSLPNHPFFVWKEETPRDKVLWIIITSNKGLCWWYNINVMKKVSNYIKENLWENMDFITMGKRGAKFVAKTGHNLIADYSSIFSDHIEPVMMKTVSKDLRDEYLSGKYKKVVIFYNHYINTIKQVPTMRPFLPIIPEEIKDYLLTIVGEDIDLEKELLIGSDFSEYKIEPNKEEILDEIIPLILDLMFYEIILEAKASEHSARMVAMKSAKDNASKIAWALTLKYNKARQAMITKEVSEITWWVEALKDI